MSINDRVTQISTTIQELRQASADGRRSRQLLDQLFRTVHTFKAAAAAEGLTHLSRTAHEFEDVLQALRTGKLTLDGEVLRVFDETVIALRDGTDTSPLNSFNEVTRHPPTRVDDLPAEFASLKEDERHRAAAALREGANLYVMNVEFEVTDFDERFRELKARLEDVAEIISVSPRMQDDCLSFHVVYASDSEKIPLQTVLQQAVRAGHAAASALNKQIEFVVKSDELLLGKPESEVLADALLHLVRNAVDHGIDSNGSVVLEVTTESGEIQISVTDDGRGITPENLPLIFQPGFSTAAEVSELSGRGVGLDAVKAAVEELGGSVSVTSEVTRGSTFQIKLPNRSKTPNPSSDA